MNILLIVPVYPKVILDTTSIPIGLASIATCLKNEGYNVKCIDCSITNLEMQPIDYSEFDIIGIQLHSVESLADGITYIKNIRKRTLANIVVGGVVATMYYKSITSCKEIDYIILNEGEYTFLELVKAIQQGKDINSIAGLVVNSDPPVITMPRRMIDNIDKLPIIDRSLFEWDKYKQWSIITSRGCPFKCKFCTVPSFWKNTYRQRSPENVFKEICILVEQYGVNKIFILDDSFTANKGKTLKLLSMIKDYKLHFEWACLTRADLLDEELVSTMAETGCSTISIGVESANQDTLDYLNKNIKLHTIEYAIFLIKKYKIRVRCSYIFGFPNETEHHLKNNIMFIKKTLPDEVQIYPLFPYFGTELFREQDMGFQNFVKGKDALHPLIGTSSLSKEDIAEYVKQCVDMLQAEGYVWLSSYSTLPQKGNFNKVVMTEFAPIQSLDKQ